MKYLLFCLLLVAIDSAAQKDTTISSSIITSGSIYEGNWAIGSHSISKPDTIGVFMLYCDTTEGEYQGISNTTLRFVNNACYWGTGYVVTQVNKPTYYLDDDKQIFDKVVWMSFARKTLIQK